MNELDCAREYLSRKIPLIRLAPNQKFPDEVDPYGRATMNPDVINRWLVHGHNLGVPGGVEYIPGQFLVIVDVDCKDGRNGFDTIKSLELAGFELPPTLSQTTPSNGLHLIYWAPGLAKNGANVLGKGIDVRGYHGHVVAAGGQINGKKYEFKERCEIGRLPDWVWDRVKKQESDREAGALVSQRRLSVVHDVNEERAASRSRDYLLSQGHAEKGARNETGFKVAARLKDFGVSEGRCFELMAADWKCEPPLEDHELRAVVSSAYRYGQNPAGVDSPEHVFSSDVSTDTKPKHPLDKLNERFFFVPKGGAGRVYDLDSGSDSEDFAAMPVAAFHNLMLPEKIQLGNGRVMPLSQMWMEWPNRRTFLGFTFQPVPPGQPIVHSKLYNEFKGFAYAPLAQVPVGGERAVDAFLEHLFENVALKNDEHFNWILDWLADIVQFPQRKSGVAIALTGGKGVGKSVISGILGFLLGNHACVIDNRESVFNRFNGILANKLLVTLDEAFWSGDKAHEGVLKGMITGERRAIERKGLEAFTIPACERYLIISNEDWVVPATHDERRFAVFAVGDKRRQDHTFFDSMVEGMTRFNGAAKLLHILATREIKSNVRLAPITDAIIGQKLEGLGPIESWWYECLSEGYIPEIGADDPWGKTVAVSQLKKSLERFMAERRIRGPFPSNRRWGSTFKKIAPSCFTRVRLRVEGQKVAVYHLADLDTARKEFGGLYGLNWEE